MINPTDYEKTFNLYKDNLTEIYNKWKEWPLFQEHLLNVPEDRIKEITLILDSQWLMNQAHETPLSKRSLEIAAKVFSEFVPFDMINIQPMLGPAGITYYTKFRYSKTAGSDDINAIPEKSELPEINLVIEGKDIASKTRSLKLRFKSEDLDNIDDLAVKVREEITREIFTDIRNNVGTIGKAIMPELNYESLYVKIIELSGVIHRKTLRGGANWLVTGPKIAEFLASACHLGSCDFTKINCIGVLNGRWKLIVDPEFPENEILIGCKDRLIEGYTYCPYVFLTSTPVILDPETFKPQYGLLTRYGKVLNSSKPYARLTIEK